MTSTRQRGTSCAPCRATTRSLPKRFRKIASCSARPVCRARLPDLDTSLPVTPLAMLGGAPQPLLVEFPGLSRNIRTLEQAAAGFGVLTIKTEHDGIVRRVPADHAGARHHDAVAVVRGAAHCEQDRHGAGQDPTRPASRASACAGSMSRPTATASSGCISRRTIHRSTCLPLTCWTGWFRRTPSRDASCLIGTSAVGLAGRSRPRRSIR